MSMKQDFIAEQIVRGRNEKELNELWDKFENGDEEKGEWGFRKMFPTMPDEDIQERVRDRIRTYYLKENLRRGDEYEAVIIGYSRTDYGKTKLYNEALELDKKNHEQAVVEGKVNEEGQPLNRSGFNKGEPMGINDVWEKKCFGVYRKAGTQDKFMPTAIIIKEGTSNMKVPFFSLTKFWANKGRGNEDKLIVSKATAKMDVISELSETQVKELLFEYYKDNIKNIGQLNEYVEMRDPSNKNDFVVVQGGVVQVSITQESKSNALTICEKSTSSNLDDIKTLTCWVDKSIPLNLSEMALDVMVIGRAGKNRDGVLNMNLYGYYCQPEYRRPTDLKPVEGPAENSGEWIQ